MTNLKKPKLKVCKTCAATFQPYKTTDKFCSRKCAVEGTKTTTKKPITPIAKVSAKQRGKNAEYLRVRDNFMSQSENKYCPVCAAVFRGEISMPQFEHLIRVNRGLIFATEVHHLAGRVGDLLTDTSNFLAVSTIGHRWIHENPLEAGSKGFLRGRINKNAYNE